MSGAAAAAGVGVVIDAAIAADMILTLIEKFKKLGVEVKVSDLDAQLAARKAARKKAMEDAGLI
jgi:hypothetical protein